MRIFPLLIVGVVLTALLSPGTFAKIQAAATDAITPDASVSATDQKTYDRICPLFGVYDDIDGQGRDAIATTIRKLAQTAGSTTDDPALHAVLTVVPVALGAGSPRASREARNLVARECQVHRN